MGIPTGTSSLKFGIGRQLQRSYKIYARRPAIIDGELRLDYRELGNRVENIVQALHSMGIERGARLLIATKNRAEFFQVEHAAFVGGFVRVAISPRLHPREVIHQINDSEAVIAFADAEWTGHLLEHRKEVPSLRHIVCFDEPRPHNAISFESFVSQRDTSQQFEPPPPDLIAALLYTSGTTGAAKGVMMSQGTLTAVTRNHLVDLSPVDETDIVLHVGPLAHMSGVFSWCYFVRGACHVTLPTFTPEDVLDTIHRLSITTLLLVPTMLNMLTDCAERSDFQSKSLRTIMYGASAIAPERLAIAIRVFGDVFVQCYGQSEFQLISTLPRSAHKIPNGETLRHLASAGRPNPYVEIRIVSADGDILPTEAIGEISVRSDTTMQGYWGLPDATAEILSDDGWLLTGDVGLIGDDGYLYIVDRRRDMIVSGGYNIYPSEVERAIYGLAAVQDVAVVGIPDEKWGEAVAAVVVLKTGYTLDVETIKNACRDQLARYKVPKQIFFENALPKSPVGKILRREIKEEFWKDRSRRVG